ncbi:lysine--tRNA ligase [Candidatus Woesearchaeota archaeon]|nr:lysine--tRNA ligase [Candidatus Woesearchaeota archaeon]
MTVRNMGKAAFFNLQDQDGTIQIYIRKDDVGESYKVFKKCDLGDFVGIKGECFKTKTGELSIRARDFTLLTKAIRPLPEKYHGIKDTEIKYRKRYLDLITNPESREIFIKRSKMISAIREFLNEKGFLEVETPVLHTIYGGAAAKPFTTHHNELNMDLFLRISPELYLKRLLVGGFEKVYDINKNFRNEGIDTTHNPEFTMMEVYQAYADYNDMMHLLEQMYEYVALKVLGTTKIKFKDQEIDVKAPWDRITMAEAIKKYAKIDVLNMSADELMAFIKENNIEFDKEERWGNMITVIYEELCEDKFINPTFILDHPLESTPLCKTHRDDDRLIERFEPMCMGMELANAYSELNDPIQQRKLLEDQQRQLAKGDEEANPLDEDFIQAIEQGMPPAGGLGVGIDRMLMLLLGQESIRDIIFFPTMKPIVEEKKESKKKE